jgi:hypothetical protein
MGVHGISLGTLKDGRSEAPAVFSQIGLRIFQGEADQRKHQMGILALKNSFKFLLIQSDTCFLSLSE